MVITDRPVWCPNKNCRCVGATQDIVCAGALPDRVRVCLRGKGHPLTLDKLTGEDIADVRDLFELVDDARVAQLERAAR